MEGLFDLTQVFGDILGDTPNSLLAKGIRLAEVAPGRMADVLQPTQANALRRAAGGLFGVDTSNERERLRTALGQLDLQDPAQAAKAVELVRAVDPAAAGSLQAQLQAAQEASMLRQAQTAAQQSTISRNEQSTALDTARLAEDVQQNAATRLSDSQNRALRQAELSQNVYNSNQPSIYNTGRGEIVSVDRDGTSKVIFRSDDGATTENKLAELMAKRTALNSAAMLSYPNDPAAQRVLQQNIDAGNIESAADFNDYVPTREAVGAIELPVAALNMITENQTTSVKSSNTLDRIGALINTIETEGLLDVNSPAAGLVGRARERLFDEAGIRDTVSILRTGTTREINTEIINSLPPGVASDRDIAIFSKGYPPEGTNTAELYEYLQAAQRINQATVDVTRLRETHWLSQTSKGDSVSDLGFLNKLDQYKANVESLDEYIQQAQSLQDQEEAQRLINEAFSAFSNEFGFIPTKYR